MGPIEKLMKTASLKTLATTADHLKRRATTAENKVVQLKTKLASEVTAGKTRRKLLDEATAADRASRLTLSLCLDLAHGTRRSRETTQTYSGRLSEQRNCEYATGAPL